MNWSPRKFRQAHLRRILPEENDWQVHTTFPLCPGLVVQQPCVGKSRLLFPENGSAPRALTKKIIPFLGEKVGQSKSFHVGQESAAGAGFPLGLRSANEKIPQPAPQTLPLALTAQKMPQAAPANIQGGLEPQYLADSHDAVRRCVAFQLEGFQVAQHGSSFFLRQINSSVILQLSCQNPDFLGLGPGGAKSQSLFDCHFRFDSLHQARQFPAQDPEKVIQRHQADKLPVIIDHG
jgi:hypothetical protein